MILTHDTLYIPIDTIANQGNTSYQGIQFGSAADFLLILSEKTVARSSWILTTT
jgi:hypothetical protein